MACSRAVNIWIETIIPLLSCSVMECLAVSSGDVRAREWGWLSGLAGLIIDV